MGEGFKIADGFLDLHADRAGADSSVDRFLADTDAKLKAAGASGGDSFTRETRRSVSDRLSDVLGEEGTKAGEKFTRTTGERLRDARGRFRKLGEDLGGDTGDGIGEQAGRSFIRSFIDSAGKMGSQAATGLSGILSEFITPQGAALTLGVLAGGAAAAGAALQVLPPILSAVAGGLAAIPAIAVGAGAALGTLALGWMGVSDAIGKLWKPAAGGGIDNTAAAERRLAAAQRDVTRAQDDLNRAREQAVDDLREMGLQVARVHLDERAAALAVQEAERELQKTLRRTKDPLEIERAQLAYEQAKQSLAETKERAGDLEVANRRAQAAGVEGSDKVKSALERQRAAADALVDAQDALAKHAGGAASALDKLSPNARAFVEEIRRLKPELDGLQQLAQQHMFAGLDSDLGRLVRDWLPTARKDVGMLSDDWNGLIRQFMRSIDKPQVMTAVDHVAAAVDRLFGRFTGTTLDPLVDAVTKLVDAATPFAESLGNDIMDWLDDFSAWIDTKAKDGSLDKFFADAASNAKTLFNIGEDVFGILGDLFNIVSGKDQDPNGNALDHIHETLQDVQAWLESPEGKEAVKHWIEDLKQAAHAVEDVIGWIARIEPVLEVADGLFGGVLTHWDGAVRMVKVQWDIMILAMLGGLDLLLTGADKAFGWIPGLGPKLHEARAFIDKFVTDANNDLAGIQDQDVHIRLHVDDDREQRALYRRWGGIRYAADGLVRFGVAGVFAEHDRPTYGVAEPGTGGELFMPHNGDRARNRSIAMVAAEWAGLAAYDPHSGATAGTAAGGPAVSGTAPMAPVFGGDVYILADFGDGVRQVVRGVITDNPQLVAAATDEGRRQRGFTDTARARR